MFNYTCLNPIAGVGLDLFSDDYKKVDDIKDADAALVRSAAMHDMELGDKVLAVARAGAGVNNIPLDKCAEQGIVVFNTPGANANGVKELVFAGMLYASRDIVGVLTGVLQTRTMRILQRQPRSRKRTLQEQRFQARSSVLSDLEPSVYLLQMLQYIWAWMFTDMIHTSQ